MSAFTDPVAGQAFTDADGLDARTEWLRRWNPIGTNLLFGASLYLAAYDVPSDWEAADGIDNSGSGGAAGDAALVTVAQKGVAVDAADISVVTHANGRGVQIDETASGESFVISENALWTVDDTDGGMWTIDFTVLIDTGSGATASRKFLDAYEGANIVKFDDAGAPAIGSVMEWVDNIGGGAGSGGLVGAFNDDTADFGYGGQVYARPATGTRIQFSQKFDRANSTYSQWLSGSLQTTVFGAGSLEDLDTVGSLDGSNDPYTGSGMVLHNLCFHQAGSAGFADPAGVHAAMAATG